MARIRSVHPGQWTDEAFVSVSAFARLLALALRNEADDQGVFEWKPVGLKMRLLPADDVDVPALLAELEGVNIVKKFEIDGRRFGAIRNFGKWQRPKSPQRVHPCPNDITHYAALEEGLEAAAPTRGTALGRLLCDRQDGTCHYCASEITFYRKKATSLEIDHRIPVSRGGSDHLDNLVAVCKPCNSLKRNMTDDEFAQQFTCDELAENCETRRTEAAKVAKQLNSPASQSAKTANVELDPQRKDVGGRREDVGGKTPTPSASVSAPSAVPSAAPAEKPPKPGKAIKARLATDWTLPDDWRDWATTELLPGGAGLAAIQPWINRAAARFRDHWLASGQPNAAKTDWLAAWRNWIREDVDRGRAPRREAPKPGVAVYVEATPGLRSPG
ncbi:MAG: HNH endonuclease [Alphaproteobacteria bacterium]|nr:HNH endonuclease [Alphaproteobacteria bacterium]